MAGRWSARISDGNSSTTPLGAAGGVEVVFRSVATATVGTTSQITVTKPAGTVQDDVMVAFIQHDKGAAVITPPSGWTTVRQDIRESGTTPGGDVNVTAYTLRAGGAEPANYTWTFDVSPTAGAVGAIITYDNVVTAGNPVNAHNGATEIPGGTDLTVTAPSVSGTTAGSMLVAVFVATDIQGSFTPPAGMNERADLQGNDTVSTADQLFGAGGNTGDRTATVSSLGAEVYGAQMLALTPAAAGGGDTFFGVSEDVLDYSGIRVSAETTQFGTVDVEFSVDGANWRKTDSFPTVNGRFDPLGETFRSEIIPVKMRFVRVNFVNNGAAQSFFRLQTSLLPEADQPLNRTPETFRIHQAINVAASSSDPVDLLTISGDNANRALEVFAYGVVPTFQLTAATDFAYQIQLIRGALTVHRQIVRNGRESWVPIRFETRGMDITVRVRHDEVAARNFDVFVQVREP